MVDSRTNWVSQKRQLLSFKSVGKQPSNTRHEIDMQSPTKIKRKSNLNHYTYEIPHETENKPELIDEHFLEVQE